MKNTIKTLSLALAIIFSTNTLSVKKAEAGVIIGVATAGVGGALVGLTLSAAGFFWGIQSEDLNWKAGALFVLNEEVEAQNISQQLQTKYPALESYIADEIAQLVVGHSNLVEFNQNGLKEVIIPEDQLNEVLELTSMLNSDLALQLKSDLTLSSKK
jgi:hypothetical protein